MFFKELEKYCSEMLSEYGIIVKIQCLYYGEYVTINQCRECMKCFKNDEVKY